MKQCVSRMWPSEGHFCHFSSLSATSGDPCEARKSLALQGCPQGPSVLVRTVPKPSTAGGNELGHQADGG